jgi:iron complex outermembrane receptor protein
MERDASWFGQYRAGRYSGSYAVSNAYQKTGFFPGAHGIPDASRLEDDGRPRNTDLPYSTVNHLKATTHQHYTLDALQLRWDLGYQNNHREEWSLFHTHYGTQPPPPVDPDRELAFTLHTFSSNMKLRLSGTGNWDHTGGWDVLYQRNGIGGYSFLLPEFRRASVGAFWLTNYRVSETATLSGGVRYDWGRVGADAYVDSYLGAYLRKNGYPEEAIAANEVRSRAVNRRFGDWSGAVGLVWQPAPGHLLKTNVGHSFRLPGANELASNGVHHGTFRHEQGDASLGSERGWQWDAAWSYYGSWLTVHVSPFVSWYGNYIYLRPSGVWSILPHAGQIYRYTGASAFFVGGEMSVEVGLPAGFGYELGGDWVWSQNLDEGIPLSFSPPATLRNMLFWERGVVRIYGEHHGIARQGRTDRNEETTGGANLFDGGVKFLFPWGDGDVEISLIGRNLLDRCYFNHLSFYRRIEIPEMGRNFQTMVRVHF